MIEVIKVLNGINNIFSQGYTLGQIRSELKRFCELNLKKNYTCEIAESSFSAQKNEKIHIELFDKYLKYSIECNYVNNQIPTLDNFDILLKRYKHFIFYKPSDVFTEVYARFGLSFDRLFRLIPMLYLEKLKNIDEIVNILNFFKYSERAINTILYLFSED
jgi:hypothetical protein